VGVVLNPGARIHDNPGHDPLRWGRPRRLRAASTEGRAISLREYAARRVLGFYCMTSAGSEPEHRLGRRGPSCPAGPRSRISGDSPFCHTASSRPTRSRSARRAQHVISAYGVLDVDRNVPTGPPSDRSHGMLAGAAATAHGPGGSGSCAWWIDQFLSRPRKRPHSLSLSTATPRPWADVARSTPAE